MIMFPVMDTVYATLYVKLLEKLKDMTTTLDTSGDPEYVIEKAKEIKEWCSKEYKEYGYENEDECFEYECANEFNDVLREIGEAIVWDFKINDLVFVPMEKKYIYLAYGYSLEEIEEEPWEYIDTGEFGGISIDFRDLAEGYAKYHSTRVMYLGIYHSHPLTIPVPSTTDVKTASKENTILDGIDNESVGWVFAIGGWSGFLTLETLDPDAYICYQPYPGEKPWAFDCFNIYTREKMIKMTHENLLRNSRNNPDKIYIFKQISEGYDYVYYIYQQGRYKILRGEEIGEEIEKVKETYPITAP